MLSKKFLCISLMLTLGLTLMAMAETPEKPEGTVAAEGNESPDAETPDLESDTAIPEPVEAPDQKLPEPSGLELLKGADFEILGSELMGTSRYMRDAYNSFSLVPRTLRVMGEEIDKGNSFNAAFLGIFILPFDFALSRSFGSIIGSYRIGRAGDHLVAGSKVIPSELSIVLEGAGNNLRTCRTYSLLSNTLFYGGLTVIIVRFLFEENPSFIYEPIAMIAGNGLQLISPHFVGSAGKKLEIFSRSLPSDDQRQAMGEAGERLQSYEKAKYWGCGIGALGIAIAILGKGDDAILNTGVLTMIAGWVVASPVAVNNLKSAAAKIDEVGDRLMYWKE